MHDPAPPFVRTGALVAVVGAAVLLLVACAVVPSGRYSSEIRPWSGTSPMTNSGQVTWVLRD